MGENQIYCAEIAKIKSFCGRMTFPKVGVIFPEQLNGEKIELVLFKSSKYLLKLIEKRTRTDLSLYCLRENACKTNGFSYGFFKWDLKISYKSFRMYCAAVVTACGRLQ